MSALRQKQTLRFALSMSALRLSIPGTSSIAHLEENVEAAALELSDAEYLELTGVAQLAS
jgi:pyridoxine 4-dehydrogenase